MATLTEVNTLRTMMDQLNGMAGRDLNQLVAETVGRGILSPPEVTALLVETLPALLDPYAATIAELATDFYMMDRERSDATTPYKPQAVVLPDERRVAAVAGWGTSLLLEQPGATGAVLDRLTTGAQNILFDVERDTTWELSAQDSVPVNYQRMTTHSEACDFCRMLASRGAVYSDKSATSVVGRGVPTVIYANGKRNRGKGIKARGKGEGRRDLGEDYHDNDKCIGVAVHPGRAQQMEAAALDNFELYAEARERVGLRMPRDLKYDQFKSPDGSLKNKYRWEDSRTGEIITSKKQTDRIVNAMREARLERDG